MKITRERVQDYMLAIEIASYQHGTAKERKLTTEHLGDKNITDKIDVHIVRHANSVRIAKRKLLELLGL